MFSFLSPIAGGLWQLMQNRFVVGAAMTIIAGAGSQQARLLTPEEPIAVLNHPAVTVTTTAREANTTPDVFEINVAGTPLLAVQTDEVALSRETILTRMSIASTAEEIMKRTQKRRAVRSETFEVPPMHASSPELASFLEKIGLGKEGEVLAIQNGVPTWINGRALSFMPGERTAPPNRDSNASGSSGRGGGGGGSTTNTTVNTTIVNESNGWTEGTDVIYLTTNTDNVGIGTNTPSTKLEVVGTLSGSLLTLSGLANCDSIDTDADGNLICGTDDGGDSFDQDLNVADTPTFDGLELTATLSGTLLNLSGLTNCDSIDTDANGNLVCGTDAGGIGSLSLDFTDGSNTETLVDGDTVTFTGDSDIGVTLSNDGSNAVTLAFLNGSGFITADSTDTLTNKSGDISMWTNNAGYLTGITGIDITELNNNAGFITADSVEGLSNKSGDITMWTNNAGYISADSTDTLSNKSGDISMWTNNLGFISATSTDTLSNKSGDISMWTNNAGFITASSTDTLSNKSGNISMWTNDSAYITGLAWNQIGGTQSNVNISGFTNDSGYITAASSNALTNKTGAISQWTNDAGYITNSSGFITASSSDALTNKTGNISMWTNDSGYLTSLSGNISVFTNDSGFISASSVETLINKSGNISMWINDSGYITSVAGLSIASMSNDAGFIVAGDVAANETDPAYNANTFATGMDQGVATGDSVTFAGLSVAGDMTLNSDNGDTDAVLTFGNDALAETLTYSNGDSRFIFGDALQVGSLIVLDTTDFTNGAAGCSALETDTGGNLVCGTDAGGLSYFNISDGATTEQIDDTDTITFTDGTDIDVVVSATDTVTFNFTNASGFITTAGETDPVYNANTYATGMNQGVDSAAGVTFASLTISGAGTTTLNGVAYTWPGADASGVLQSDGAGGLSWVSDVSAWETDPAYNANTYATGMNQLVGSGDSPTFAGLALSGLLSCDTLDTDGSGNLVCGTDDGGLNTFSISDGATTEAIDDTDTITFTDGTDIDVVVSATDTVTFNFTNASGFITAGDVTANETDPVYNANTFAVDMDQNVGTDDSPTFAGITIAGATVLNGVSYTWPGADGAGVLRSNGAGSLGWDNNISGFTNDSAYIVAGDVAANETDPLYNANTYATGMDQNVGTADTPTFTGLNVGGTVTFSALTGCDTIDTDGSGTLSCGTDDGGLNTFSISDGATTEAIDDTDTITFTDGTDIDVVVSATDTVTFNFTNASGFITAGDVTANETDPVYNANTYATSMNQNVDTAGGPTFASLLLSGLPNCDTIDTDGSGNLACGTDDNDGTYFFLNDGVNALEQVDYNDAINFTDGTDIDVVVSAGETVTFNFTNASGFITAGDVTANETDPVYSANTFAVAMDQGVATTDGPTFSSTVLMPGASADALYLYSPDTVGEYTGIQFRDASSASFAAIRGERQSDHNGDLVFLTDNDSTPSNAMTERMRLLADGTLRIAGLTSCDTLDTDGSGNLVCGTDAGGLSYFSINDGTTTEQIDDTDNITFTDGTDIDVVVSATDTVTFNFTNATGYISDITGLNISTLTNDSGYITDITGQDLSLADNTISGFITDITGQDLSLADNTISGFITNGTETDPSYNANTYATGMDQGVATGDSPTLAGLTLNSGSSADGLALFGSTSGAGSYSGISFQNGYGYATASIRGEETSSYNGDLVFLTDNNASPDVNPTEKMRLLADGTLRITNLTSCDTIDTDGSGNLVCGTDAGGLSYFTISDASTSEQIDDTDTINFTDGTDIDVVVSAGDTVTFNFTNASAFITAGDVTANETDPAYNANTYATSMDQNVDTTAGPNFNALALTSLSGCDYIYTDGPGNLTCGTGTFAMAGDNLSSFTDDIGIITTETDPVYNANTFAVDMDQNVGSDDGPTFAGITVSNHILPDTDNTYDLGSDTFRFRDLYLGPASLHIGTSGNELVITNNAGTLEIGGSAIVTAANVSANEADPAFDAWLTAVPTLSAFTNDSGYMTTIAGQSISTLSNDSGYITAGSADTLTSKSGNISMWTNDSGYLTTLSGNISSFTNDSGYITAASADALTNKTGNISQWTNDSGYLTTLSGNISGFTNDSGYLTSIAGLNVSTLANDAGYLTTLSGNISGFTNDSGYITGVAGLSIASMSNDAGFITASSADALTNKTGAISMWTNDSGYLTTLSGNISGFTNDSGYVTAGIGVSNFTNDAGYLTTLSGNISGFTNDSGYITAASADALTNKTGAISMWTNDSGYLTTLSGNISSFTNDSGYITGVAGLSIASMSNDAGFIVAGDVTANETDPVYNANTYATGMNQGVATGDSPTFTGLTVSGLVSCDTIDTNGSGVLGCGTDAGADLAEAYPTHDETLVAGEILSMDAGSSVYVKRAEAGERVIGIYSTQPWKTMGQHEYVNERKVPVALAGRVPVKVNMEGGAVSIGDLLTLSSTPGVAKRAATGDAVIGYALDGFYADDTSTVGTVMTFVSLNDNRQAPGIEVLSEGEEAPAIDEAIALFVADTVDAQIDSLREELTALIGSGSTVNNQPADGLQTLAGDLLLDGTLFATRLESDETLLRGTTAIEGTLTVNGVAYEPTATPSISSNLTLDDLLVQNSVYVLGPITVEGLAQFLGDVHVAGELKVSGKQAGNATIPAGQTSVTVIFSSAFTSTPVVTASPDVPVLYAVSQTTQTSFTIRLGSAASEDVTFSWLALGTDDTGASDSQSESSSSASSDSVPEEPVTEEIQPEGPSPESSSSSSSSSEEIIIEEQSSSSEESSIASSEESVETPQEESAPEETPPSEEAPAPIDGE